MAEALKTITAPMKHRARVTPIRSCLSGLQAARHLYPFPETIRQWDRWRLLRTLLQFCATKLLENAAAMLVVFKLIEAGTGRREQHGVARLRVFRAAMRTSLPQRTGILERARHRSDQPRFFQPTRRSAAPGAHVRAAIRASGV
jgi:hypothetical protein